MTEYLEIVQGDITFKASSFADLASLFKKIATVTGGLRRIPKNSRHQQGWMYANWEDINSALGEELGKNNLAVITSQSKEPSFEVVGKNSNGTPNLRAFISITYVLGDGETGASASGNWYGHADDTSGGEKAIDKAATYAVKSMVKKLFLVSSGEEDPEGSDQQVDSDYQPQKQKKQTAPKQQQPPAQQSAPQQQTTQQAPKQEAQQPPVNIEKNMTTFLDAASKIGYDRDDVKDILGRFQGTKKDDGTLAYNSGVHDPFFEMLVAFKELYDAYQGMLPKGEELLYSSVESEMKNLGFLVPFNVAEVRQAAVLVPQHFMFVNEALKISPKDANKVLREANLLPWRPEKESLMLATLTAHEQAKELETSGKIEDVFKDAPKIEPAPVEEEVTTVTVAQPEAPDLFDEMFGGSMSNM